MRKIVAKVVHIIDTIVLYGVVLLIVAILGYSVVINMFCSYIKW